MDDTGHSTLALVEEGLALAEPPPRWTFDKERCPQLPYSRRIAVRPLSPAITRGQRGIHKCLIRET